MWKGRKWRQREKLKETEGKERKCLNGREETERPKKELKENEKNRS